MAHIPMGDIKELWEQSSDHSWKGLHKMLEARKGTAQGISNQLVLDMLQMVGRFEKEGKPFPSSQQQLYNELNGQLQH